jgi:hypothetical protein
MSILDVDLSAFAIPQRFSQRRDLQPQGAFLDRGAWPDGVHQILAWKSAGDRVIPPHRDSGCAPMDTIKGYLEPMELVARSRRSRMLA